MTADVATRRGGAARARARRRGYTFLEVAMAAAVLLIGVTAIVSTMPTLFGLIEHSRKLAHADRIAMSVLEDALVKHDSGTLAAGVRIDRYDERAQVSASGAFSVTLRVVDNFTVSRGRLIEATVTWAERGTTRSYVLKTYAYNK